MPSQHDSHPSQSLLKPHRRWKHAAVFRLSSVCLRCPPPSCPEVSPAAGGCLPLSLQEGSNYVLLGALCSPIQDLSQTHLDRYSLMDKKSEPISLLVITRSDARVLPACHIQWNLLAGLRYDFCYLIYLVILLSTDRKDLLIRSSRCPGTLPARFRHAPRHAPGTLPARSG